MGKMKTKKAAAKRFKLTRSGKIKMAKAGKSHILTKKKRKRKRNLRQSAIADKVDEKRIKKLLPYG